MRTRVKRKLTLEMARAMMEYNPDTGILKWRDPQPRWCYLTERGWRSASSQKGGREIGTVKAGRGINYLACFTMGYKYAVHRLVWFIHTGERPDTIDHINGKGVDNRFCNLRDVSLSENMRNRPIPRSNTTGLMNIYYEKGSDNAKKVWKVMLNLFGKQVYVGHFKTQEEATIARDAARKQFGFHKNHGRVGYGA